MPVKKIDDDQLRALVARGARNKEIAEHFGCAAVTVTQACKRLGVTLRGGRAASLKVPVEDPAPDLPVVEGLDVERVAQLLKTNGNYRKIAELAAVIGEPERKLLCQWHRVRAAA